MNFATLGPADSNHALVLSQYLQARGQYNARIHLFDTFEAAFNALTQGKVDFVMQVTAHPTHSDCVGRYMHRAFPVDSFIAPSKPLGILTRRDVDTPQSIGVQPATRYYTDLSAWPTQIEEPTTVKVAEGLLAGRYDSGITALDVAHQYPDVLRVDLDLGPALDTWVVFATTRLSNDPILWPDAPIMQLLDY